MKLWNVLGLFGVVIMFTSCSKQEYSPLPRIPAVFVLTRQEADYKKELLNTDKICAKAEAFLFSRNPSNAKRYENVIILDEGDTWFVGYFLRGNGQLQPAGKTNYAVFQEGHMYVYLDKKTLEPVRTPNNGIIGGF